MSSLSTLIPCSCLQMRALQHRLHVPRLQISPTALISWDDSCLGNLWWWFDPCHLEVGVALALPQPELMLFTDESDTGWGASLGDDQLSGLWSRDASIFSINHRELLALFLAVRGFLHHLCGRSFSLFTDNTTVLSYLRKEGGTRSSTLNSVAQAILRLCEDNAVRLLPQFVPGHLNVLADSLSRGSQVLGLEWTLYGRLSGAFPPLASNGGSLRHLTQPSAPGLLLFWIPRLRVAMCCFSLGIISRLTPSCRSG